GDCMYCIASGEVSVKLIPQPVTLKEGAFFGEIALVTGEPRSATAVAATECRLLTLDLADFRELAGRHSDLTTVIEEEATRRRMELGNEPSSELSQAANEDQAVLCAAGSD